MNIRKKNQTPLEIYVIQIYNSKIHQDVLTRSSSLNISSIRQNLHQIAATYPQPAPTRVSELLGRDLVGPKNLHF